MLPAMSDYYAKKTVDEGVGHPQTRAKLIIQGRDRTFMLSIMRCCQICAAMR